MQRMRFADIRPVRPDDFVFDETICTIKEQKPKITQDYTKEEKDCIAKKKILAVAMKKTVWPQKKSQKKELETMWEADLSKADQGHFDQRGNFVIGIPPKASFLWLVKKSQSVLGPLTSNELRSMIEDGSIADSYIRRDVDKGFLPYNSVVNDLGDLLTSYKVDEYFQKNAVANSPPQKPQEFFEDLSSMSLKKEPMKGIDRAEVLERCVKSRGYIHGKNPSITLAHIEKRISGKSFSEAVNIISKISGIKTIEAEEFLNMFLNESKLSILSDICPDGFVKVAPKPNKRTK
ncbi:hypothetical protein CWI42_090890 [Ordospora colligata]|uniref:GYF domain-containing protein n=1 Tax=Ordospora colligata OC4 TaxID=1354746 RepID=A0A0B2UII3_9MICR|nr:uncharacterized protein M896_090890 [Ordospora colligata OC4]KHN69163.1 hypothetical protein M896_090890 [Ordospora colligata OC4]TBU14618.1 hypothetical protein CWI41_090890 [Ordospora colligata]TBU14812.1 hypothetical protein CWI40_090900 [Ordospora colligata]TBU18135.1 hypothetical protein CWI42_090890 [Ordospora colligata]